MPTPLLPLHAANDAVLHPFLMAADARAADVSLGTLVEDQARPLILQILRGKASGTTLARAADLEDLCAESAANILARLVELRTGRNSEPIRSFSGYVAVVAYNSWHRFLRERFPVRARLKNRLRYLCSHDPALAVWADAAGTLLCGLAKWRGKPRSTIATERVAAIADYADEIEHAVTVEADGRPPSESHAASALLQWARGPLPLDDLVDLVGDTLGIVDAAAELHGDEDAGARRIEAIADAAPSALTALTDQEDLRCLWFEIEQLPVRQRAALLLNLRDGEGRGVIALLPMTGIASIRTIAAVLEMPAAELAALWRELPLDDAALAARLGLTRQQVINLRKSARERLARRTLAAAGVRR